MLSNDINKLSKLYHSSILTPYNLLENLELDNYLSINYYKDDGSIVADIVFLVYDTEITYRYIFDNKHFLQKNYHVDGDELVVQFDRCQETERLLDEIKWDTNLGECI